MLLQLLNNENLLVVLILNDSKLNIFGYCNIGWPIFSFLFVGDLGDPIWRWVPQENDHVSHHFGPLI